MFTPYHYPTILKFIISNYNYPYPILQRVSLIYLIESQLNSSQVKIKYEFSKPFHSKPFSKDGNHAESEQFL